MTHRYFSTPVISIVLAVGLSACGGGSDGGSVGTPVTSNEPPLSASASDAPAEPAPAEPVDLSNFTPPPTTETDDPVATSADEVI
jgi:hypothetical protein